MLVSNFELITGMPVIVGYIFTFIFGAAVGSFLNVVIHRLPRELSIVFPSSACPKCGTEIKGYDNIPVLSWLILGGKCRKCKNPISARYPAVELFTGLLWMLVFWQIGSTDASRGPCIRSAIVALMFIERAHDLANVITYPFS